MGAHAGGFQAFVRVTLRHSAAFSNLVGGAPVIADGRTLDPPYGPLTLPPSAFGNNSIIDVRVFNRTTASVDISGTLVVQKSDGSVWLEQDTADFQTVAAGATVSVNFSSNGGSAGVGLSWNSSTKQVDIASAGVYSAFVILSAIPAA